MDKPSDSEFEYTVTHTNKSYSLDENGDATKLVSPIKPKGKGWRLKNMHQDRQLAIFYWERRVNSVTVKEGVIVKSAKVKPFDMQPFAQD